MMTPQEALASTDGSIVSLQVTIRDLAKRVADWERSLVGLEPSDPEWPAIEAERALEQRHLEERQALLGRLVEARARIQESIEKAEG
ncbi:MAG TPA: hypothetical protein VGX03_11870 [Candidatus Binatia bacterium]|jgi:hypothetical protein|nr:hypothetical protein [Candidatus Binatia bacterium]